MSLLGLVVSAVADVVMRKLVQAKQGGWLLASSPHADILEDQCRKLLQGIPHRERFTLEEAMRQNGSMQHCGGVSETPTRMARVSNRASTAVEMLGGSPSRRP